MSEQKHASITLVDGHPGDGKSNLMAYLIYRKQQREHAYAYGFICSTTLYNDKIWSLVPFLRQVSLLDSPLEAIKSLVDAQVKVVDRCVKARSQPPTMCLVLDDLIGQTRFQEKEFIQLLTTSRHANIDIFISSQYTMAVSPMLRGIATTVFFSMQGDENMERVVKAYCKTLSKSEQSALLGDLLEAGEYAFVRHTRTGKYTYTIVCAPSLKDLLSKK